MNNQSTYIERLLERLVELAIANGGGGGGSSSVNITGNTAGLATDATLTNGTQTTRITDSNGNLILTDINSRLLVSDHVVDKRQREGFNSNGNIQSNSYVLYDDTGLLAGVNVSTDIADLSLIEKQALQNIFETGLGIVIVENNTPAVGDKTTYIGYSKNMIQNNQYNETNNEWSIKRIVELANGRTTFRWANANKYNMSLVFDDGIGGEQYKNYTY